MDQTRYELPKPEKFFFKTVRNVLSFPTIVFTSITTVPVRFTVEISKKYVSHNQFKKKKKV